MPNAPGTVSTTLPTRMGIAAPSVAEASSRLPSSVKAGQASADDVLVTSVASFPPAVDEPVSPELVLVDPELRERLRALLPEIELELPPPLLRAVPDPELEPDDLLPLGPPPELDAALAAHASVAPQIRDVPIYVYPTSGERFRSFGKAFALGAAAATVLTVGIVAELGEGPAAPEDAVTTPPNVSSPVPPPAGPKIASGKGTTKQSAKPQASKPQASRKPGGVTRTKQITGAARTRPQPKAATGKTKAASQKADAKQQKRTPPPAGAAEPKRFAWAPVDGAVGYRFELFRGDKQVLEVRTKDPVYELASSWRHAGRAETLSSGRYRWYVWPVLATGPASAAVVQARLTVP